MLSFPAQRALWIALAVNASMFLLEMGVGVVASIAAGRRLDILGDSTNCAIGLGVAVSCSVGGSGRPGQGRDVACFGCMGGREHSMACLGWHLAAARIHGWGGADGGADVGVAVPLFRFRREGDANMRSVWICSRNDAIGNLAVLAAAIGVFGTGTAWRDAIIAAIMTPLGIFGGWIADQGP